MIGSLLYLIASLLDIMFVVCLYAPFLSSPEESHLTAVKYDMRYLTGIQQLGFWYHNWANCDIVRYTHFDFYRCILDRKSICATCHLLGNSPVFWHRKKQVNVALSTIEEKYIVVGTFFSLIFSGWNKNYVITVLIFELSR